MAVFTIQSPDGRKIKVEAADEETAMRGAKEYVAANPPGGTEPIQSNATQLQGKVSDLPSQRPSLGDEAMSFGRGVIEGIPIAGPMLSDARRGLDANIMSMLHGGEAGTYQDQLKQQDEALRAKTGGARLAGNIGGSIAGLAPLGMTAVGGRMLGMTGNLGSRIAMGGASGAGITAADTLARGGSLEDAGGGAALGGAIGAALPVVGTAIRRAISPTVGNASKVRAANVLQREGVELTAGQRTGSKKLQYSEAELGGQGAENFMEQQADQFTGAALRRIGVQANRATPDVVDAAHVNIGQMFDDLAARNGLQTDARLVQDLQRAFRNFDNVTNASTRPPLVERFLQDFAGRLQNGYAFLDGNWFKSTRSELARVARGTTNPELGEAVRDIIAALDHAMERTLQQVNPADLGAWQEARRLYANLMVIDDAVGRAGEKAADGIITPQALRGAAMRQNKRSFVRGRNQFTELANAGVSAMTPLPNSGTAGRLGAKMMLPLGATAGATLGSSMGPLGALAGGAIGAAVPWAAGRAMLSGAGRRYFGNQVANRVPPLLPPASVPVAIEQQR